MFKFQFLKTILYLHVFIFLFFSKGLAAETFEELMISTWGNHLEKDLSASEEIETRYFKCTRELKNESIREAKAKRTYKYIVKMDNNVYFEPIRYNCQIEMCNDWQYRYTAVGGIDVYGNNYPDFAGGENTASSVFIYENSLMLLETYGENKKTSFQCTELRSFFELIKSKVLFLTQKTRQSFNRWWRQNI